jgi:hypothetical protein
MGGMTAIDDLELFGKKTDGTRIIRIRNKSKNKTIAASVHIGGACDESYFAVTLKPLKEAWVASEGPRDTQCAYEINSARYVAN